MVSVKTPINTEDVRERAARKLSRFNSSKRNRNDKSVAVTGDMVKPIHVSKSEPLVRRMTSYQPNN